MSENGQPFGVGERSTRSREWAEWCQATFNMIAEGGTWGVPRSGLLFERRGTKLVLVNVMPLDEIPEDERESLAAYQREDYRIIKEQFEFVGIPVESEVADYDV